MKKVSKAILIALAAMLVLGFAGLFGLNLYLQSPGVQARIQEEISRSLRVPLTITNTSLTPWSDLRITGITIPNGGTNLLEAASFNARYRIGPLFTGELVIYEMSVDSPKIVWAQNEAGKWVLPAPEETAEISAENAEQKQKPKVSEPAKSKPGSGFQVRIEGFEIKHGDVELRNHAQEPIATFTDVNIRYSTMTADRMEGVAQIQRAQWNGYAVFEEVRTPFVFADGDLNLTGLTSKIGGGSLGGDFTLRTKEKKQPFSVGLKIDGVDLTRAAADGGWSAAQAAGVLGGTIDLAGSSQEMARGDGRAQLVLRDGRFRQFSHLEIIGQALGIRELSDLRAESSTANVRIADEKAFIEDLQIDAGELQLSAKGIARFDGKLQLAARVTTTDRLIKELPGLVRNGFTLGADGARYVDFNINGKVNKPKTDLLDKVVGERIDGQFDDLLTSIFGTAKKKEEEKKAEEPKREKEKKKDETKKKKETSKGASAPARTGLRLVAVSQ
ncbi:MAG TPA: AsmA family protein [Chthoniobacteraceae bacterium]|nr:AsmA family protein [Chthoniobacteraceae bacterium]